jgi:hypothetical protein
MATYGNSTDNPTPKPADLPTRRAIWIGLSFVLLLVVLISIFLIAAGRIERRNYYQPNNQSPTPAPAPAPLNP